MKTPRIAASRTGRLLAAFLVLAASAWLARTPVSPAPEPAVAREGDTAHAAALPAFLPAEAMPVIARIQHGAAHPYPQDGQVFGNRERRLPRQAHGYYREYTVPTPGLSHRGARRIITGGRPPLHWYYTDDHYDSFRAFQPPPMPPPR